MHVHVVAHIHVHVHTERQSWSVMLCVYYFQRKYPHCMLIVFRISKLACFVNSRQQRGVVNEFGSHLLMCIDMIVCHLMPVRLSLDCVSPGRLCYVN